MVPAILTALLVAPSAIAQQVKDPENSVTIIRDIEDGVISIPASSKCSLEPVKTKDGILFRIETEDFTLVATQLQMKAPAVAGDPIIVCGIQKPEMTLKHFDLKWTATKTIEGCRVKFTIGNLSLLTSRAIIENTDADNKTRRVSSLKAKSDGLIEWDTKLVPWSDLVPIKP
jgi:hypothetical protein